MRRNLWKRKENYGFALERIENITKTNVLRFETNGKRNENIIFARAFIEHTMKTHALHMKLWNIIMKCMFRVGIYANRHENTGVACEP